MKTGLKKFEIFGSLVLDDLGTQNATPWAEEKLYQILNHRYINRLPTVITTNQEFAEIEGRIRSRLQDPDLVTIVRILAPDFRSPIRDERRTISTLELLRRLHVWNFQYARSRKT